MKLLSSTTIITLLIAFTLFTSGCGENNCPEIEAVKASEETVKTGKQVDIEAVAKDRDGDNLTYKYVASDGTITGTGSKVKWTAPNQIGEYSITATVSDGKGSDTQEITIKVKNTPPEIKDVIVSKETVKPGEQVDIETVAEDRNGDTLTYKYEASGGTIAGTGSKVKWKAPNQMGEYSITVTVSDGETNSPPRTLTISTCPIPPVLSPPIDVTAYHVPSGWMGDGEQGTKFITVDEECQENPRSPPTCTKWTYKRGPVGWAAVAYQYPENNWGQCKGIEIKGATKLTFWAKGENGGEIVDFKMGCMLDTEPYRDSLCVAKKVALTNKWQQYELDLVGEDTSCVIWGFVWATNRSVTFYLDDIMIE